MANVSDDLVMHNDNDPDAFGMFECSFCAASTQMFVVRMVEQGWGAPGVAWLRCMSCRRGAVLNDRYGLAPSTMPLDVPQGLDADTEATWNEVRSCLSARAFTASVMMCRKLLMHMAVTEGLPEKDDKDRAPNFFQCIDHLQSEGVITKRNRKWVDRIKDIGNEANHDLASIDKEQATTVATFTRQLLHEVYELPFLEANT
ncbi:DUF4145 domain-containing protein [Rhodococcus sp. IEGM 1401]|uniref:DUF4145 domain-containing protein n=1 Tax=unclassified Rhodococcus (in: high G+C Gram-positive bacteria) TaxID=192944 RepID=UPI0022B32BC7|nr:MULTISPECIES: DUF4145 domain-containing protein [unclassified Rhodococcus (in: high G+C Gram-positive bacteria)]MCZ4563558.1 DUF4145 domain-containing protein [Rhodococcus sp. IEGM 1401]MDI9923686.1 DUF4145 domain-containing protein [Rhodococcus sp. IEGM 1372]MDV8036173.1 DUF4145 domain-containing protein [Rhodococcus sp. IEGM 1414]